MQNDDPFDLIVFYQKLNKDIKKFEERNDEFSLTEFYFKLLKFIKGKNKTLENYILNSLIGNNDMDLGELNQDQIQQMAL